MTVSFMPRDVATRWNSTFDMLEYALKHRKAVDVVTQQRELGLRKFELSDDEWLVVEQLYSVLKVRPCSCFVSKYYKHKQLPCLLGLHQILKDATLFFSRSTPNLATVIPAMDHIDQQLTTYARDKKYLRSIRSGVSLAKKTLNRYYSLTDSSEVYRIAMSR
jgi:hypothetical protein